MAKEYIEREAALDVANGWREQLLPNYGENDEYVKCLETVAEHLYDIPTADVREVVRGRWKKSYADHEAFGVRPFFHYCSECHEATVHQYNYCPNCGADMREV